MGIGGLCDWGIGDWRATGSQCGRVAACCDRKACHWKLAGRPKGIPFSSGRTKTDRTPKTSKTWLSECLRTWHARKPACHRPANPRRSAHPRHIPGGLGSLVRLGQGASPAKRPGAHPGHQPAPTQLAIGNIGNWQHLHIGNIPPLPCAAKMAAFPVRLRATDWDSRLPGGGIPSHYAVATSCDPPREHTAVAQERASPAPTTSY